MRRSLFRYLLVGCVNTAVGLGLIYLCMYALGMRNAPANLIGYAVGVLVSFVLNKSWTFAHQGSYLPALGRFLLVLLVAYGANLLTVLLLADRWDFNRYVAQAAGVIPYTLIGYVGSRWFAFRSPTATAAASAPPIGTGE
ncbi:MAG TPA: GtrA family protein [Rhodanobacter sp.]|jgi:putative flippase GtrA